MANVNTKERRRHFKSEARFLLRCNYVKQVFMTAVAVLLAFGLNAVKSNVISLLEFEYSNFAVPLEIFFDMAAFLIILPIYMGIIYVDIKLFEGENVPVGGMFEYFLSSLNLIDCYRFVLSMAARLCAFALPFMIFGGMIASGRELLGAIFPFSVTADIAMLAVSVIYFAAFAVCAVVMMRYFAAAFIFVKNPCLSIHEVINKSTQLMRHNKIEALNMVLSFGFWIVLSHYLAGFLFIFFTLPYIILSYTSYLSYLLIERGGEEFLSPASDYVEYPGNEFYTHSHSPISAVKKAGGLKSVDIFEDIETPDPYAIIDVDNTDYGNQPTTGNVSIMTQKTKEY